MASLVTAMRMFESNQKVLQMQSDRMSREITGDRRLSTLDREEKRPGHISRKQQPVRGALDTFFRQESPITNR